MYNLKKYTFYTDEKFTVIGKTIHDLSKKENDFFLQNCNLLNLPKNGKTSKNGRKTKKQKEKMF